jgi:hypothetical protein
VSNPFPLLPLIGIPQTNAHSVLQNLALAIEVDAGSGEDLLLCEHLGFQQ